MSFLRQAPSRFSTAGDRGESVAEGVRLIVDCLSEQLDDALGALGAVAVGPVASVVSMGVTATSALLTTGQGMYDEVTGKDTYDLSIAADTQPLTNDTPIDIRGVGVVEAGMTIAEAERATGQDFTFSQFDVFDRVCYYAEAQGVSAYSFMIESPDPRDPVSQPQDGVIARVHAGVRTQQGTHTVSGLGPGDPRRAVESTYDRLTASPHVYATEGVYLDRYGSGDDAAFGMRFVIDNGRIDAIFAGDREAIQRIEGCA